MSKPIDDGYPLPVDLVRYECETLEFILSYMSSIDGRLISDAQEALRKYKNGYELEFESSFDCLLYNRYVEVNIGALVETIERRRYNRVSYYALLTDGERTVYRKLHFDYHPDARNRNHSIFHLQYGGELAGKHEAQYSRDDYFSWLKEPRIPFKPMSLALLMHLLFINIDGEEFAKVRSMDEWQQLVHRNEEFLWQNYLTNCYQYLVRARRKLMFDYYCGNC